MGTLIPNRATEPPPAATILLAAFRLRGVAYTLIRTPVPLDFHLPSLLSWKSRPWIGKQTVKFSASSGPSTTDENFILCGFMWPHVALCGRMWLYVAACGLMWPHVA